MDYQKTNKAILDERTLDRPDEDVYVYLLNNNVAYFYSKNLASPKTFFDKKIIGIGHKFNECYVETLRLIDEICKKEEIEYALFKTYKYIDEAVDGDIDLFVKKDYFDRFMLLMAKSGFACTETEKQKGSCVRADFCKVEPRVKASFQGIEVVGEDEIWKNTEEVEISGMKITKTTKELDVLYLLLNILYGPNYLKLYLYKVAQSIDVNTLSGLISDNKVKEDFELILRPMLNNDNVGKRFPLFPSTLTFSYWWTKRILFDYANPLSVRIKHLLFFFYSKSMFVFSNKLPFTHNWELNYGK